MTWLIALFGLDLVFSVFVVAVCIGVGLVVFGLLLNASARSEGHEDWTKDDSRDFADNLPWE